MMEEGTLSIVMDAHGYHVRYASNNYHHLDRQPSTCPDEAALAALLHACGLDVWSIQQTCAELRRGRVAVMSIVCAPAQLEASFPLASPRDATVVGHPQRVATRQTIRTLLFPQEQR